MSLASASGKPFFCSFSGLVMVSYMVLVLESSCPLLAFPEIPPLRCMYNFCSSTDRYLSWLCLPHSLSSLCQGAGVAVTVFAYLCLNCDTGRKHVVLVTRRIHCFLEEMLPTRVLHMGSRWWLPVDQNDDSVWLPPNWLSFMTSRRVHG